ncbi:Branched-chain amino acid transport protein (AzlD) [Kushneria avicenniae]|uniref:Branched-chain amino acid transport protein (AzlD) n=1 Tax=Kushneria avicenniae TaxID=402385 RepID=A0A1I1KKT8_9GAMM|nr:AzlD domain-containing protein [Kushneria avicenniae]SFC59288.1 Branched-chain amino acid transport protein (AzlD) [Kushneria avicenniae]
MKSDIWLAAGAAAVGTLLIRMLPLYWIQRRWQRAEGKETIMPSWPGVLAPLMIAALLGISMVPQNTGTEGWSATMMGSLVTLLIWHRTRTLGLPVAFGVAAYALVRMGGS